MYQVAHPDLCRQLVADRREQLERSLRVARLHREARDARRAARPHREVRDARRVHRRPHR